jgi:hypothetical protein
VCAHKIRFIFGILFNAETVPVELSHGVPQCNNPCFIFDVSRLLGIQSFEKRVQSFGLSHKGKKIHTRPLEHFH